MLWTLALDNDGLDSLFQKGTDLAVGAHFDYVIRGMISEMKLCSLQGCIDTSGSTGSGTIRATDGQPSEELK